MHAIKQGAYIYPQVRDEDMETEISQLTVILKGFGNPSKCTVLKDQAGFMYDIF